MEGGVPWLYPGWAVAERGLSRPASRVSHLASARPSVQPHPSARPGKDEVTQERMNRPGWEHSSSSRSSSSNSRGCWRSRKGTWVVRFRGRRYGSLLRAPGPSEFDAASDSFGMITFR